MLPIARTLDSAGSANRAQQLIRLLVAAVLAELVFLQHGRLLTPEGPSVRIPLFVATLGVTMASAGILPLSSRRMLFGCMTVWLLASVFMLGVAVPAWGLAVAAVHGTPWNYSYADANGHLFHLITIPMVASLRRDDTGWLIRILGRIVTVFSCGCLVVYVAAVIDNKASDAVLHFVSTSHFGSLNQFTDGRPYRLFFKSYVFVLCCFVLMGRLALTGRARIEDWITFVVTGLVLWNSYTRSIWLMAGLSLALLAILEHRRRALAWLVPVLGAAVATPLVASPDALGRLRLDDRDGTIAVRLRQVTALLESWLARPITGAGFGTPIAAGGVSVELDLLNLLRKIGLVGAAFYVAAFWAPLAHCRRALARSPGCPDHVAVFLAACMSVFGMGFFNPYATASLGVGLLAIGFATLSAGEAGAAPVPRSSERPEIRDEIPDLVGGERLEAGGPLG